MDKKLATIKASLADKQPLSDDQVKYLLSLSPNACVNNYGGWVAWYADIDVTDGGATRDIIRITWLPNKAYNKAAEQRQSLIGEADHKQYTDETYTQEQYNADIEEADSLIPDSDNACDWENPYSIELR